MISLTKRPPGLILSNSPAWFQILNTGENKKISATISAPGAEIASVYTYSTLNDTAFFEFSEFFKNTVVPEYTGFHNPGSFITLITSDVIKHFTVVFSDEDNNSITETVSVLFGNLSPDILAVTNYGKSPFYTIADYLNAYSCLTIRPDTVNVFYETQPERICFCSPSPKGTITLSLQIYHADGAGYSVSLGSFASTAASFHLVSASYDKIVKPNIPALHEKNPVSAYVLTFSSGNNGTPRSFKYNVRFLSKAKGSFFFVNSLGGLDTFCPTGSLEITSGLNAEYTRNVSASGLNKDLFFNNSHLTEQVFIQNSGFISFDDAKWLSQLLFSKKAWWVDLTGKAFPVSLSTSSIKSRDIRNKLYSVDIKYFLNPNAKPEEL